MRLCVEWALGHGGRSYRYALGLRHFEQSKGVEPLQTPRSDSASFSAAVCSSRGHLPETGHIQCLVLLQ